MAKRPARTGGGNGEESRPALTAPAALLGVAGLVAIVAGFLLLSRGSITAAPLLLVAGYAILVPLAIVR